MYPQQGGVPRVYPEAIFFEVNAGVGLFSGTFWGLLDSGISVFGGDAKPNSSSTH